MTIRRYDRSFRGGLEGKYAQVFARLPAGATVLEIGCATGFFLRYLLDAGFDVTGLEVDEEAVAIAQAQGLPVMRGSAEEAGWAARLSKQFDIVLLMDVLEHLVSPETALRQVKSVLRPGGRILVTGPNVAYWAIRLNLLLGRWDYQDAGIMDRTHRRFLTAATWCQLLRENGWRVTTIAPTEGMIPLEGRLRAWRVPAKVVAVMVQVAVRLRPALFTVVYFLEAVPA